MKTNFEHNAHSGFMQQEFKHEIGEARQGLTKLKHQRSPQDIEFQKDFGLEVSPSTDLKQQQLNISRA